MRTHRPRYSELTPEQLRKARARSLAKHALRRGILVRQPCEVCGSKRVEKHHDDYDQPLSVRWFCFRHHRDLHRSEAMKEAA
jgi:hypothetical protein